MASDEPPRLVEETLSFELAASVPLPPPPSSAAMHAARVPHAAMQDAHFAAAAADVAAAKSGIDGVSDRDWRQARDVVFPLDRSGVSSDVGASLFHNRAGHKLHQTMQTTAMWPSILAYLDAARAARRPAPLATTALTAVAAAAPASPAAGDGDDAAADGGAPGLKKRRTEAKKGRHQPTHGIAPHCVRPHELTFLDVCGGPGAFSQLLFNTKPKKKIKLEGFGLTLMDEHVGAPAGWYPELPEKHGFGACFGVDGTGNIYDPANVEAFVSLVRDRPVRLVVADGGFEVPPSEMNLQEALMARITFAQFYVALRTLKSGGCFVLKLFDVFTTFNASMLFLCCFFWRRVVIVKPQHSRAVNSERYLACLGFRGADSDFSPT